MICVSIGNVSVSECIRRLRGLELAEVRLDTMDVNPSCVKRIFSVPARLVATCRQGRYSDRKRLDLLLSAIDAGAAYVDVETQSPHEWKETIIAGALDHRTKVIVSYHNYRKTPGPKLLKKIVTDAFLSGAHLAKVACMVRGTMDNLRLLNLLSMKGCSGRIIVTGMGDLGRITRVASVFLGSPFTYAYHENENPLAPGQMNAGRLQETMELIRHG